MGIYKFSICYMIAFFAGSISSANVFVISKVMLRGYVLFGLIMVEILLVKFNAHLMIQRIYFLLASVAFIVVVLVPN